MSKTQKEYLVNGDNFFPNTQTSRADKLPAGAYECRVTMEGAPYFEPLVLILLEPSGSSA